MQAHTSLVFTGFLTYWARDVNECEETNGGCETLCCNTIGSFYCKCPSGQELKEDGKTCQGERKILMIESDLYRRHQRDEARVLRYMIKHAAATCHGLSIRVVMSLLSSLCATLHSISISSAAAAY
ncbi:multiple epidermal growth factor-like domains protein 6 isoform X1 [Tachysurus ichikawai]